MMEIKTIGTHDGVFHADEVMATAILLKIYPEATVIRTRDEALLATCDVVYDVGGGEYDHHTTEKQFRESGIPFAAAGLIWRDFGAELVSESVMTVIDQDLLSGIDAVDNGYALTLDPHLQTIPSMISAFNPAWNRSADKNEAFFKAVEFATTILDNAIEITQAAEEAADVVKEAFANRVQKEVLILPTACPWIGTLLAIDTEKEVLFVIFPEDSGEQRIQVVPKEANTFEARKDLPLTWAGKRDKELNAIIEIDDAVFCHPARFIAGAKSQSSILKMAQIALR